MKTLTTILIASLAAASASAAPKKLLVVTSTMGFRHSSIPTSEKILAHLAANSGEFTIDLVPQPAGRPAPLKKDATDEQKAAFKAAEAAWTKAVKAALEKLSPDSLKQYDGVAFINTSGELPIPDRQGFLDWIKAGHAFIGLHAATDTFHGWPEFLEMLGGEFLGHGPQVCVECLNQDASHPATVKLGKSWVIEQEEIYLFKNYDRAKVHDLLSLDKHPNNQTPGHYPVSWSKSYGQGRVFHTSLGHREDLWDADPDIKDRKNPVETSLKFQAHLLGGIEWALRLKSP